MKFMGIPIDGTMESFVQKLKTKGLKYKGTEDGMANLTGEFAAISDCNIYVVRFSDRNQVRQVMVAFPITDDWSTLADTYFNLKKNLTVKYGEPQSVVEAKDKESSDNHIKLIKLVMDESKYVSVFTCENGKIELSMTKAGMLSARVLLRYFDNANTAELQKRMMDDL
jgi:hypothetical protein